MKTRGVALILILSLGVLPAHARINQASASLPLPKIPSKFQALSEIEILQWGCPVEDLVKAGSQQEAIAMMGTQCLEAVRKGAAARPEVIEVMKQSLDEPEITVTPQGRLYLIRGTIFVNTWSMLVPHPASIR